MIFTHGQQVQWKDDTGYVNFVDEEYITICVHEWEKCEYIKQHAKRPTNQINVVCPNVYWKDVIIIKDDK
jgi:hypothetical protein